MGTSGSTSMHRIDSAKKTTSDDTLRKICQFLRRIPSTWSGDEFDVDSAAKIIADNSQRIKPKKSTFIIKKGDSGEGVYIILSGEVVVLAEGEEQQPLAHIMEGEFFGEVSCFFEVPCSATVMAEGKTKLLFIPKDILESVLHPSVKTRDKDSDQLEWFVERRYLPTTDSIQKEILEHQMATSCLKTTPLFSSWPLEALESLVMLMEDPVLVVYPPGACILQAGDPADPLVILLRGRATVTENGENIQEIKCRRLAFIFGEEGLFCGGDKKLTVRAAVCCLVMQVRHHWLYRVLRQHSASLNTSWAKCRRSWEEFSGRKNHQFLTTFPAVYLQFEVIYQKFCQVRELLQFPVGFIHELILGCEIMAVDRHLHYDIVEEGIFAMFILIGEVTVTLHDHTEIFRAGSLIGKVLVDAGDTFQLVAKETSAVVKIWKKSVKCAVDNYPDCKPLIASNMFKPEL